METFLVLLRKEKFRGADELHCVVHWGTIMAILSVLATPVRAYFDWQVAYCEGYLLDEASDGRALRLVKKLCIEEGSERS